MAKNITHRHNWTYGSNTIISIVLFLAILVVIVLIAERHPWRVDLTKNKSFTLSEQTLNILGSIKEPIEVSAFYATASPEWNDANDLLETYRYHNDKISYQFIDPDRNPEKAEQYEVRSYGTLVLNGYGKRQTIQSANEESLTNAISRLTRKKQKKILFLIGHGEPSIDGFDKDGYSSVKSVLQKDNYTVEELNLLQHEQVPDDTAILIIAGPHKPLFNEEVAALKTYLNQGGKIMILLEPYADGGLQKFLESYGIVLSQDIVIDKLSKVFGGSYLMPVVTEYGFHKITKEFRLATFYPEARSVRPMEEPPKGVHLDVLASTSPNAWAETDFAMLQQGQASFDEKKDRPGPVPLVVLCEVQLKELQGAETPHGPKNQDKDPAQSDQKNPATKAYLLAAGDSDFINNTHFGLSGNGDFFLNMVHFLADEENLIVINARKGEGQPVVLTDSQAQMLLWTVLVFMPLVVIVAGFIVYRVRRSQR